MRSTLMVFYGCDQASLSSLSQQLKSVRRVDRYDTKP